MDNISGLETPLHFSNLLQRLIAGIHKNNAPEYWSCSPLGNKVNMNVRLGLGTDESEYLKNFKGTKGLWAWQEWIKCLNCHQGFVKTRSHLRWKHHDSFKGEWKYKHNSKTFVMVAEETLLKVFKYQHQKTF